ncbi:MAG: phenylacetate-CoA oxygenase subunit PaaC [Proteobacteria bacterium]|nr:phenylacetate-CoA oxygenase subunit PaaC [Pseudomonadota bacterium]
MSAVQSVVPSHDAQVRYVLRLADACLIHAQRLSEWCGHAPILEEDIALTNMALDLLGQSRALLTHAGQLSGRTGGPALTEDQLAFLREERDYLNPTLVELPRGDFAQAVLRNALVAIWLHLTWQRLATSSDAELVAVAAKAEKEARYHVQHFGDWVIRLGDGTAESLRRMQAAVDGQWRYLAELFEDDVVDVQARERGWGPMASELQAPFDAAVGALMAEAGLAVPAASPFRSTGRRGVHSEHLGHLLTPMQHLQRSFPGGVW